MSPADLATIERALSSLAIDEAAAVSAIEALGELRRRAESATVTGFARLQQFCASYRGGITLVASEAPHEAPDTLGLAGATSCAQLVGDGRTVLAVPSIDSLHSVAHEVGHAIALLEHGDVKDERRAVLEQIAFLVNLGRELLGEGALAPQSPSV